MRHFRDLCPQPPPLQFAGWRQPTKTVRGTRLGVWRRGWEWALGDAHLVRLRAGQTILMKAERRRERERRDGGGRHTGKKESSRAAQVG